MDFKSTVDLSKINIKVTAIDPNIDRAKYIAEKECVTCNTSLGKQGSKKYFCHFCYSAVCAACSPLLVMHPESGKEEKTCNPCYIDFLKLIVLDTGEEYVKLKLKQEIEEKELEIIKRKELAEELEKTKTMAETEKSQLNLQLSLKDSEIQEKDSKIKAIEDENRRIKEFLEDMVKKGLVDKLDEQGKPVSSKTQNPRSSTCMNCVVF